MNTHHTQVFRTTVVGVGPFCVEFGDGEIVTTRTEDRARLIAAAPELFSLLKAIVHEYDQTYDADQDSNGMWSSAASVPVDVMAQAQRLVAKF